ncbi:hypothetical protein VNO77_35648 [Canavalia gladiata]|uniref:K-box domain-containing protein n=1 Tax=Canavalia gladiata TaxID=3824 RepID=A0AAN9PW54_CANGL
MKFTEGAQSEALPLDAKEETNVLKQEIETLQKGIRYLFEGGNGTTTMDELQVLEKNLEIWIYHIRSMKMNIMLQEIQALRDKIVENTAVTDFAPFAMESSYPLILQDGVFQL